MARKLFIAGLPALFFSVAIHAQPAAPPQLPPTPQQRLAAWPKGESDAFAEAARKFGLNAQQLAAAPLQEAVRQIDHVVAALEKKAQAQAKPAPRPQLDEREVQGIRGSIDYFRRDYDIQIEKSKRSPGYYSDSYRQAALAAAQKDLKELDQLSLQLPIAEKKRNEAQAEAQRKWGEAEGLRQRASQEFQSKKNEAAHLRAYLTKLAIRCGSQYQCPLSLSCKTVGVEKETVLVCER